MGVVKNTNFQSISLEFVCWATLHFYFHEQITLKTKPEVSRSQSSRKYSFYVDFITEISVISYDMAWAYSVVQMQSAKDFGKAGIPTYKKVLTF